jgi:hypothetical protein
MYVFLPLAKTAHAKKLRRCLRLRLVYGKQLLLTSYFLSVMLLFSGLSDEAPSSSGLGYLVLIQKIAGSNPAGVTIILS